MNVEGCTIEVTSDATPASGLSTLDPRLRRAKCNVNEAPRHNGKLYIETVGCQMNMLDSELVVGA